MPVMALADKYNVHDLMALCKNFMLENIPTAAKSNQLWNWLQYSFACGHNHLGNILITLFGYQLLLKCIIID